MKEIVERVRKYQKFASKLEKKLGGWNDDSINSPIPGTPSANN